MTPILVTALLLLTDVSKIFCGTDDGESPSADLPTENGVLVLTGQTFPGVIQNNEFVLVMFSTAKCGHCQRLMPTYEEVAAELGQPEQQPAVRVAKVTLAADDRDLVDQYEIRGVPDVRLFRGGNPVAKYQDERTKEAIVGWVKGKVAE